jgi:hypothetical protein
MAKSQGLNRLSGGARPTAHALNMGLSGGIP